MDGGQSCGFFTPASHQLCKKSAWLFLPLGAGHIMTSGLNECISKLIPHPCERCISGSNWYSGTGKCGKDLISHSPGLQSPGKGDGEAADPLRAAGSSPCVIWTYYKPLQVFCGNYTVHCAKATWHSTQGRYMWMSSVPCYQVCFCHLPGMLLCSWKHVMLVAMSWFLGPQYDSRPSAVLWRIAKDHPWQACTSFNEHSAWILFPSKLDFHMWKMWGNIQAGASPPFILMWLFPRGKVSTSPECIIATWGAAKEFYFNVPLWINIPFGLPITGAKKKSEIPTACYLSRLWWTLKVIREIIFFSLKGSVI